MERTLKFHPTPKSSTPQHAPETTLPERVSRRAIRARIALRLPDGYLASFRLWSCDGHDRSELYLLGAGSGGRVCIMVAPPVRFAKVRGFGSITRAGLSVAKRNLGATEMIENNEVEIDETFAVRSNVALTIGKITCTPENRKGAAPRNSVRSSVAVSNGRRFRPWRPGRSGFAPDE